MESYSLEWNDVNYAVKVGNPGFKKEKPILNNISGKIKSGEMVAIMGPSGAGKSTLLNILSGRIPNVGEVTLNGEKAKPSLLKRLVGYAMQDEVFFHHLTVRETISFAARMKMEEGSSKERTEELLEKLSLQRCADTPVGGPTVRGVSGGERKRTNIAVEIVHKPPLIFLDEPTSGLDSATSVKLISYLRELANQGHTVLLTIHQPSSFIFDLFDRIMLMTTGGYLAYDGSPQRFLSHMEEEGFPACADHINPAEYMIEQVSAEQNKHLVRNLIDKMQVRERRVDSFDQEMQEMEGATKVKLDKYAIPFYLQLLMLTWRSFKQRRKELLTWFYCLQITVISVVFGCVWFQLKDREASIPSRGGFFFYSVVFWTIQGAILSIYSFAPERNVVEKERSSATYRLSAYFLGKILGELPVEVVLPLLFCTITYWMIGLSDTAQGYFLYLLILLLTLFMNSSMGILLSSIITDTSKSVRFAGTLGMCSSALASFLVSSGDIPIWFSWSRWLSIVKYPYEALMIADLDFVGHEFAPASPSAYTSNPITGQDVLDRYGVDTTFWGDMLFLVGMTLTMRVLSYLALRTLNKRKY
ncbi:ABC2 type transporter superfamily protein [Brazilian cedratvirus IHUMI]|uniref:ABC2 type transporter superfamily protein n=1 Tax=Brazilian cedratvirus IHUMI TaxID=2126980 RepID=A0A2R8FG22_9VIRU|nr:ABC2 type transporter superfamily protein [Brazilian cedratvirus IHUMI]